MKTCTECKIKKPITDFYKNGKRYHTYCKKCNTSKVLERQRNLKRKAVNYKGGKCSMCGYNKCLGALEFHHLNPAEKDPSWKKFKNRKFNNITKQELDKCILVCSNCHRELHYKAFMV